MRDELRRYPPRRGLFLNGYAYWYPRRGLVAVALVVVLVTIVALLGLVPALVVTFR